MGLSSSHTEDKDNDVGHSEMAQDLPCPQLWALTKLKCAQQQAKATRATLIYLKQILSYSKNPENGKDSRFFLELQMSVDVVKRLVYELETQMNRQWLGDPEELELGPVADARHLSDTAYRMCDSLHKMEKMLQQFQYQIGTDMFDLDLEALQPVIEGVVEKTERLGELSERIEYEAGIPESHKIYKWQRGKAYPRALGGGTPL